MKGLLQVVGGDTEVRPAWVLLYLYSAMFAVCTGASLVLGQYAAGISTLALQALALSVLVLFKSLIFAQMFHFFASSYAAHPQAGGQGYPCFWQSLRNTAAYALILPVALITQSGGLLFLSLLAITVYVLWSDMKTIAALYQIPRPMAWKAALAPLAISVFFSAALWLLALLAIIISVASA